MTSGNFPRPDFILVALALFAAAGGCASRQRGEGNTSAGTSHASQLPDFELGTLDGARFRLSDHIGREVILLDFWATWCAPCLASMPHIEALYRKYRKEGLLVVGIAIDGPDTVAQVRNEVNQRGITFPILLDTETRVVSLYNPNGTAPFSVLIGRQGTILTKREGYSDGGEGMDREVEAALSAK